jgi:hypothetical protein
MTTLKCNILCVTLDVDGIRLCETLSRVAADKRRKGLFGRKSCYNPKFFKAIETLIYQELPDVFAITTQDEDANGTYFHAEYLPMRMKELSYTAYRRLKIENVGQLKYDDLTKQPSSSALRLSIYVKEDELDNWNKHRASVENMYINSLPVLKEEFHGGALSIRMFHEYFGRIQVIAANLPNSIEAAKITNDQQYLEYREYANIVTEQGIQNIVTKLAKDYEHLVMLGDFNADFLPADKNAWRADDLLTQLKAPGRILSNMQEGVDNAGPTFAPTYRLHRKNVVTDEFEQIFNAQDYEVKGVQRYGFPDRIFYRDVRNGKTTCNYYKRIVVADTQHAGVIASLTIN